MGQEFALLVSASIFCVGTVGFIIRKNPLIMFMSVELMLNSVNFLLVAYSSFLNSLDVDCIRANTNATTIMIGEKVADWIKEGR